MENTRENFMEYLLERNLADSTIEQYILYYDLFSPLEPSKKTVRSFLVKHTSTITRAFMKNYLEFLEIDNIKIPEKRKTQKKRVAKVMSDDDIALMKLGLYEVNEKYGLMFELALEGGLRRDELTSIIPDNFEWDNWGKNMNRPCHLHIIGKGNKERIVLVSPSLMHKLRKFTMEKLHSGKLKMDDKLFGIGNHRWWQILKDTSIILLGEKKRVKPHAIRHTRATQLFESDKFNVNDLKNFLGHENIQTTQIYLHPDEKKTLKKFEEFLME